MAELGVQNPLAECAFINLLDGVLDFKKYMGEMCPQVYWLKSNRPANSLSCISLSWPIELQRGHFYLCQYLDCYSHTGSKHQSL